MPLIANFGEAILVSVTAALVALLSFLPALIGAIILLAIGWFLSSLIARVITTLLRRVGFDTVAQRTGVTGFITMTGARDASASMILGELVKWLIRLIFIEMAAEALHISAVTTLINRVVLFIPNLIIALVVLMIGVMIANFVAGIARGGAAEMGFKSPNLLGGLARYAIIAFAVIVALNQVGIAATLVNTLFMALVGAIALAIGLAFGLGGREVAGQMWQQWYSTGRGAATKLEQKAAEKPAMPAPAQAQAQTYAEMPPSYQSAATPPPPSAPHQIHEERVG